MGASDRDYFRDEEQRYSRQAAGGQPAIPPFTKFLLIANLGIYFIDLLFLGEAVNRWGEFTIRSAFGSGRIWELITFQFLHASLGHVLFNSIGIYFFGPWAERWWGTRRFAAFYLLCGVAGALFYTLLALSGILPARGFSYADVPLVGASAGIFGSILCVAVIAPQAMVRLLIPPVSMTLRTAAIVFVGLAVLVILGDILIGGSWFENSGGEAGHLGGAILGFLLTRYPYLLGKPGGGSGNVIRPPEFRRKKHPAKLRPRTEIEIATASEVDRILEKIHREGTGSLTEEERQILDRASKTINDR